MNRSRVVVRLSVETEVEVADHGYLGEDTTIAAHIAKAISDAQSWRFLVQRGGLEPKQVPAVVKLNSITIIPSED